MKAYLLLVCLFFGLSVSKAHSFKAVRNLNLKDDISSTSTLDRDDDDEKDKKCRKKHKHYHDCKGYSRHRHEHEKCREHDDEDDHCHHSYCKHRSKKGRLVIELPRVVIPFPAKH